MPRDKWTLLLVRGNDEPTRQITVSPRTVRLALAGVVASAVAFVALCAALGMGAPAHLQALRLAHENRLLTKDLGDIRSQVDQMEDRLAQLSRKSADYRTLAGLDQIDPEVLQAGVGGPGSAVPEHQNLWDTDSTLSKETFAVSYDLNALERRARLLAESMDEATDSLQAHYDLLESTPSILPTAGLLSSPFSSSRMHPIAHRPLPHEGIDLSAPRGTPILAAADGRVIYAGRRSGYGLMVEIDHGYGYTTLYGHASKLLVREGQKVKRGDVIAQVGSTGIATASHLHYEVRVGGKPVNPLNYILRGAIP